MPRRLEVSPPSGIFIARTDLPNAGALYMATNETGTAQTLRVSWATSVNVRAQLHDDSTILDGMSALWTLQPFSLDMQILTLRKLRADWITRTEIEADLISGMGAGWVWLACYPPPPCNSHALVQATVGVETVLIWYFCVAITKGGGTLVW